MKSKKICDRCKGKKMIPGNCECNMEWRDSEGDDCISEPDQKCPDGNGTGFIENDPRATDT